MPTQDNAAAPIIPAGTEKTVYGTNTFPASNPLATGQAPVAPVVIPAGNSVQNAPEGTTFAELAAKKGWSTPDQMAAGYANLESHNKKVEMTAADILKAVQPEPVAPVAPTPTPLPNTATNPDEAAIQIVQAIVKNQVKPLEEQIKLQDLFLRNPDAKDYAEGIAKAVKENPGITWEAALKLAKFDALEQKATETGKQQAYQTINTKQGMIAGQSAPTHASQPDLRSIIKDRSIPFKEVDRMVREHLSNQQ